MGVNRCTNDLLCEADLPARLIEIWSFACKEQRKEMQDLTFIGTTDKLRQMDEVNGGGFIMNSLLKDAFTATVARDYEKAVNVIRGALPAKEPFGVEDLELIDHVYACILNTSHYDQGVIEVCWEWIDALERVPRQQDARVVASSQLSIYYAYHTIGRVQDRIAKKPTHQQMREETWRRIKCSFQYLWSCAIQFWRAFELDRLDILANWSYLAMQFNDVVDEQTLQIIQNGKDHSAQVISSTIVLDNSHQAVQRLNTIERNLKDTRTMAEKSGRILKAMPADDFNENELNDEDIIPIKKFKTEC